MTKEFSFGSINKALTLNDNAPEIELNNDNINYALHVADDIVDVFAKHEISMEDAYIILNSLADAIYMYAATRD